MEKHIKSQLIKCNAKFASSTVAMVLKAPAKSIKAVDVAITTSPNIAKFIFLNKRSFLEVMQKDERLLVNFLDEISNKGQLLSKRIWFNFMNKTINEKVLSYIKENQKNGYISFKPNISELAKKFEVTRPSLSREISSLCDKGILTKIKSGKYKFNSDNI